jgi:hypothetical protein
MGLRAEIYTSRLGSCSNGGISERHQTVTVVNAEGPFSPTDDAPPVLLVKGNLPGTVKIVPASMDTPGEYQPAEPLGMLGPMAGGCYVDTSDSRFGEAISRIIGGMPAAHGPVALHDRFETQAQYDALSR